MNYHNPEQLSEWGQADGWRLLTTEEIKQPLPDDAECRRITDGQWHSSTRIGAFGADHITYRTKKPLPVSQLITKLDAEIKAKQELRDIALAVEAGAEWEVRCRGDRDCWHKADYDLPWYLDEERFVYWQVRLKPKPVTRRWSKPEDVLDVWVRFKSEPTTRYRISTIDADSIRFHVFRVAFANIEQLEQSATPNDPESWKPCEVTEEAK